MDKKGTGRGEVSSNGAGLPLSLWSTRFWKKQGFVDFVEGEQKNLKVYVDRYTLKVDWTTPMIYDTVGPRVLPVPRLGLPSASTKTLKQKPQQTPSVPFV